MSLLTAFFWTIASAVVIVVMASLLLLLIPRLRVPEYTASVLRGTVFAIACIGIVVLVLRVADGTYTSVGHSELTPLQKHFGAV